MKKTHKTAVVIIPPEEVWAPIQSIRKTYDRHVARWMPHINLFYPFRPPEQFDALAERFSRVCRKLDPFPVTLKNFGSFSHSASSRTLWLAPEPERFVVQLQRSLLDVVPDCDDVSHFGGGYTPHLSLGQVNSDVVIRLHPEIKYSTNGDDANIPLAPTDVDATARELLAHFQSRWTPITFSVASIFFLLRSDAPDDRFRVAKEIHLGIAAAPPV